MTAMRDFSPTMDGVMFQASKRLLATIVNVEISRNSCRFLQKKELRLGRRRRRVVKVVKKKLPSVFTCPSCGEEAIRVKLPTGAGVAVVQCGACGLKREFQATPSSQIVDVYCMFTDSYYTKAKAPTESVPAQNPQPATPPA